MVENKLSMLPTPLSRAYAMAMSLEIDATVGRNLSQVYGSPIGAVIAPPAIVLLDEALEADDDLQADVLLFTISVVALIADDLWDPQPYVHHEDDGEVLLVVGREYVLGGDPGQPMGALAMLMADRCGRGEPVPCFEILKPST